MRWKKSSKGEGDEAPGSPEGEKSWSMWLVLREHRKLPSDPNRHRVPVASPVSSPTSPADQAHDNHSSVDMARFGIRSQEVSRVNGMKKKDTALNCLVSAPLSAMVYGSGEVGVARPDALISLSTLNIVLGPTAQDKSFPTVPHSPQSTPGQLPFYGHEEELGKIGSFPNDTLCIQVRRPGDNETGTGRYHDPGVPREAQSSGLEAIQRYPKAILILKPVETCPLGKGHVTHI